MRLIAQTGRRYTLCTCRPADSTDAPLQCADCEQSSLPSRQNQAPSSYPGRDFSPRDFPPRDFPPRRRPVSAPDHPSDTKVISGKRTPRKRSLASFEQSMLSEPLDTRDRTRGNRELSRDGSSTARERNAQFGRELMGHICAFLCHDRQPVLLT